MRPQFNAPVSQGMSIRAVSMHHHHHQKQQQQQQQQHTHEQTYQRGHQHRLDQDMASGGGGLLPTKKRPRPVPTNHSDSGDVHQGGGVPRLMAQSRPVDGVRSSWREVASEGYIATGENGTFLSSKQQPTNAMSRQDVERKQQQQQALEARMEEYKQQQQKQTLDARMVEYKQQQQQQQQKQTLDARMGELKQQQQQQQRKGWPPQHELPWAAGKADSRQGGSPPARPSSEQEHTGERIGWKPQVQPNGTAEEMQLLRRLKQQKYQQQHQQQKHQQQQKQRSHVAAVRSKGSSRTGSGSSPQTAVTRPPTTASPEQKASVEHPAAATKELILLKNGHGVSCSVTHVTSLRCNTFDLFNSILRKKLHGTVCIPQALYERSTTSKGLMRNPLNTERR